MPAHHKPSTKGVGLKLDSHAGPTVGDRSFEYYFTSPMAFQEAMQKARELEKKGMYRRAWRVRLNLDGEQPVYAPARPDTEPPPELTEKERRSCAARKNG